MIGFAMTLPIEASTPRAMRVTSDCCPDGPATVTAELEVIEGPVLIIPLSDTEAAAVRAWLQGRLSPRAA